MRGEGGAVVLPVGMVEAAGRLELEEDFDVGMVNALGVLLQAGCVCVCARARFHISVWLRACKTRERVCARKGVRA